MGPVLTAAAQVMLTVIPIVAIVMGAIIIFFFLLWRHKQHLKLIERGIEPPSTVDLKSFSLLAGLISAGVGFVLSVFFVVKDGAAYSLLGGLIPFAVGLSLLAYYVLRDHERPR